MLLRLFTCAMTLAFLGLTWAATPATPRKTAKKTASTTSSKKSSGKKSTARRGTTWRNRQMVPTPARYRQIQEALVAKNYLESGDATGVWTQTSIDALKRFQADQNIAANGKINSLSLIALGLGPKRDAVVKPPPPPAAQ